MQNWLLSIFYAEGNIPLLGESASQQGAPLWGWLHLISSLAIFGACTAIPLLFIYFLKRRPDLPWPRLWWLFALFIFACGTVHLLEACLFFWPVGPLLGIVRVLTAIASWAAVLALLPILPMVLSFRSPAELEREVRLRTAEIQSATRRMQEYDERLRLALQAGRMGTWNWDLYRNEIEFDETQIELTGLGRRNHVVPSEQFLERVHRDDREALDLALQRSIETQEPFNHVFRMYVPDKGYRWLQGRGSVLAGNGRVAARMVGVNFDITDQMADQDALRVRDRAIEFATNGIVITEARSDDQPIVYVNPAFESLTGYVAREVLGKNCRLLQGPATDPHAVDKIREAIRCQVECEVTILNYRRDGTPFWNNLQIAPVENDQGTVTHFVGVQIDVTERVEHERRLVVAQAAAESANRAKSEFLANMSHEIRTPLTAILGCADSLYRELDDEVPRESARTIRSQGHLLLGILNDVLDLSKIEAGKLEIQREPCSVLTIVSDVRSLMDPQASKRGLELITHFESPLPESFLTDPLRFRQILLNLVSNAIKFTERGRVEVRVWCAQHENQAFLQVTVQDTGVGIPPERLSAIFDAFTQVDESVTRRMSGTGLGLTICQKLVRMLGGEISVESRLGVGSTFTVSFPLSNEESEELYTVDELTERKYQKESNESLDVLIPARVLIAEDTKAIQFMLARMLEPVVREVKIVENGALAVEEVERTLGSEREPFDIVLMDMQMPVMNGYDAVARLRRQGVQLPIVALTAGAMAGDRERCLAAGCTDYLAKPVSRSQLMSMLLTYCNPGARKQG